MSSSIASITSTVSSATVSPTTTPQQQGNDNQVNFYRNLFYILIGLLGAFASLSLLSLFRARHRRRIIHAEATRLGLLAPGMPGYISIRERRSARWNTPGAKLARETHPPSWWEIGSAGWMTSWTRPTAIRGYSGSIPTSSAFGFGFTSTSANPSTSKHPYDPIPSDDLSFSEKSDTFSPLAIIPPQPTEPASRPLPVSNLKYFPKHLAYRPEDLLPPPLVWGDTAKLAEQVDGLKGEKVELVTMIRMPESPEAVRDRLKGVEKVRAAGGEEEEDGEEVLREWGGVCLGVIRVGVKTDPQVDMAEGQMGDGQRRSTGSRYEV